jgi:hypothetical protein
VDGLQSWLARPLAKGTRKSLINPLTKENLEFILNKVSKTKTRRTKEK